MSRNFKRTSVIAIACSLLPWIPLAPAATASQKSVSTSRCGWDTSSGWVARENLKAGSPSWDAGIPLEYSGDYTVVEPKTAPAIAPVPNPNAKPVEGWFDKTSAQCGDSVGLHMTANGKPVTIKVFRMGYYKGADARLIQTVVTKPVAANPKFHVTAAPESTVTTNWPITWTLKVSKATPPGQYLVRLDDGGSDSSLVPLTISNPLAKSDMTMVSSVLTWQSYNQWGGYSLYKGPNHNKLTRANIVSFNRPYDGAGDGQFRYMEYPILKLAEQVGLNLNYVTDLELNQNGSSLANTSSVVLGGHAEYWTTQMRNVLQSAVNRGVNLISFGGNAIYNRPRYDLKTRQITMWRGSKSDPSSKDPILATTVWRSDPILQPESVLLGSQYVGLGVDGNYRVEHPDRWPFNTERHPNMMNSIVGLEVDSPLYSPGPAVEALATANIIFSGKHVTTMATYYTNSKGAGVLDIGTNGWTCAIDNICPWHPNISKDTQTDSRLVTLQLLKGLAKGPLGKWRPAITNIPARTKTIPISSLP
jgi:hypothetical protein